MRRQRRAREGQEKRKRKRENRRPILKKLCAALLRSFRGQHSKKIKGSARGNWDIPHQSTAVSTWWCSPRPLLGWVEMAVGLAEGPSYQQIFVGKTGCLHNKVSHITPHKYPSG